MDDERTPSEKYVDSLNEFLLPLDSNEITMLGQILQSTAMRKTLAILLHERLSESQSLAQHRLGNPEDVYDMAVAQGRIQGSVTLVHRLIDLGTQKEDEDGE